MNTPIPNPIHHPAPVMQVKITNGSILGLRRQMIIHNIHDMIVHMNIDVIMVWISDPVTLLLFKGK